MSRFRLVVVLSAATSILLVVVVLRAETTRYSYEISRLERRADMLRLELRQKELELARQRDPAAIRRRLAELRLDGTAASAEKSAVRKPGGR